MPVFIPIGHDQGIRKLPWMTISIIAACTLVQIYATVMAPSHAELQRLVDARDSLDPVVLGQQTRALLERIPILRFGYQTGSGLNFNLLASAFVHEGWLHLIGNMLFLWLGGSVLEDRWGRGRFLLFYLVGAAAATLCFDQFYRGQPTILVGASGAISAVLGAFLVLYARTQITILYWWNFRSGTFQLAAYFALPLWLGMQILWAKLGAMAGVSDVAYAAHIGGFVTGAAVAIAVRLIAGKREDPHDDRAAASPDLPTGAALSNDRIARCMEVIGKRDRVAVRTLGSRTIIELSRADDHARVLELYDAMEASFDGAPITDGALAMVALAADTLDNVPRYVQIANAFDHAHPMSSQLPKVLWRLAQLHRDAGRVEAAVATLETLSTRFPLDSFGEQARAALDSRRPTA